MLSYLTRDIGEWRGIQMKTRTNHPLEKFHSFKLENMAEPVTGIMVTRVRGQNRTEVNRHSVA